MSKKKMRRTEMYLTEKQHQAVSKEAGNRGINFSEMFRKIVDYYLERKMKNCLNCGKELKGKQKMN